MREEKYAQDVIMIFVGDIIVVSSAIFSLLWNGYSIVCILKCNLVCFIATISIFFTSELSDYIKYWRIHILAI